MGKEAAIKPLEDEIELVVTEEAAPLEDGFEAPEEVAPVVVAENEIILDGEEGSQPDNQVGIKKRINKLNAKVNAANGEAAEATQESSQLREQNKLLKMALEQSRGAPPAATMPDQNDFDEGVKDPKFIAAMNEYQMPMIEAAVQRQTQHLAPQNDDVDSNLVKMQTKHYERADELAIKGFDEVEDVAVGILGKEITNGLIKSSANSHLIMYYLGKNPNKAEHFADLMKTDPVKATLDLGALGAKLSVKPKSTTEPVPDPDDELQGGSPAAGQSSKHQRLVDKAREAVLKGTSTMRAVIDAKKAALKAGATII